MNASIAAVIFAAFALPATASTVPDLSDLFERVNPSVVTVKTLEPEPILGAAAESRLSMQLGTGVLVSRDGAILTSAHLVQVAERVVVEIHTGATLAAEVLGVVAPADVALLRLDEVPPEMTVAPLGDSDRTRIGDPIFVVGVPYGIGRSLTAGHVSGRRRLGEFIDGFVDAEFLQIDASVNQGSSGGPVFNLQGEVVGIVSRMLSRSGGFEVIGFAATSVTARDLLLEERPFWLGLQGVFLEGDLANAFQLPTGGALLVQRVAPGSPGARLGLIGGHLPATLGDRSMLLGGDIVLSIQGVPIGDETRYVRLREALDTLGPDDVLSVEVWRNGRRETLSCRWQQ